MVPKAPYKKVYSGELGNEMLLEFMNQSWKLPQIMHWSVAEQGNTALEVPSGNLRDIELPSVSAWALITPEVLNRYLREE